MNKYLKRTDFEIVHTVNSCIAKVNRAKKYRWSSLTEKEEDATVKLLCQRLELTEKQARFLIKVDIAKHLAKRMYTVEHPEVSPAFIDLLQVKRQLLGNMFFPCFGCGLFSLMLLLSGIGIIANGGLDSLVSTLFYCALWLLFLAICLPTLLRNARVLFLKPSTPASPTRTVNVKIQKVYPGRGFSESRRGERGFIPVYYVSFLVEIDSQTETLIYPLVNEQVEYREFNLWAVKRALQSLCKGSHPMEIADNSMVVDAGEAFRQRVENIFEGYEK